MHVVVKPSPSPTYLPCLAWHTILPQDLQNPPAVHVCASPGSVTLAQGSNPASPYCTDPRSLNSTFHLLFLIFTPPSQNTWSSYHPRNCLHLAACSSDLEERNLLLCLRLPESTMENQANGGGLWPLCVFMHVTVTCKGVERGCFVQIWATGMGQECSSKTLT